MLLLKTSLEPKSLWVLLDTSPCVPTARFLLAFPHKNRAEWDGQEISRPWGVYREILPDDRSSCKQS